MEPRISVHGPDDGACLAVIHADGHISDTDDPALVLRLRAALADAGEVHLCAGPLSSAANAQDPRSLGWAAAVLSALKRHGLHGRAVMDEHDGPVVYQTPS